MINKKCVFNVKIIIYYIKGNVTYKFLNVKFKKKIIVYNV